MSLPAGAPKPAEPETTQAPAASPTVWTEQGEAGQGSLIQVQPAGEPTTWHDNNPGSGPVPSDPSPGRKRLVDIGPTFEQLQQENKQKHVSNMQKWVLFGVGVILLVVFALILVAVWITHSLTREFSLELGRMILPSLVGSGATIVGALFVSNSRKD